MSLDAAEAYMAYFLNPQLPLGFYPVYTDCFGDRAASAEARGRFVDPCEVPPRAPDIIIGSWCGKPFRPERLRSITEWQDVPAIRDNRLEEIKSPLMLQPGPAALTEGLEALERIIHDGVTQ